MLKYQDMKDRADRIRNMICDRAREACQEAGLDPNLLGIHPHNAMIDREAGRLWPEVNYSKCRLTLRLLDYQWEPGRIVDRWYRRQLSATVAELFK